MLPNPVDEITGFLQLICHLAQEDPTFDLGLTPFPSIDNLVRFHVQDLLSELFQVGIELQTGPTGRKADGEDVGGFATWNVIHLMFVDDLDGVVIDETNITEILVGIPEQVV